MPVVPFSPQVPRQERKVEFTSAQEPWALMAAAQMDVEGRLVKEPGSFLGELKEGSSEHKSWTEGKPNAAVRKPEDPEKFMRDRPDEEGAYLPGSNMLWLRKKQPPRDDRDLVS